LQYKLKKQIRQEANHGNEFLLFTLRALTTNATH